MLNNLLALHSCVRTRVRNVYGHVESSGGCARHRTFEHSGLAGKAKAAFQPRSLFPLNGILFLGEGPYPGAGSFILPSGFQEDYCDASLWSFPSNPLL